MRILKNYLCGYTLYSAIEDCESGKCCIITYKIIDGKVFSSEVIKEGLTEDEALDYMEFFDEYEVC